MSKKENVPTFKPSNFQTYLMEKGQSNKTIQSNLKNLYNYINWTAQENIESEFSTHTEILSYIKHLQKRGIKQRTVQIYLGSLKHYFNWLITTEKREDNPVNNINIKGIKRKSLYHILKKEELEQLYNNYPIPSQDSQHKNQNWFQTSVLASKRNKIILGLIIYQGITSTELGMLALKDINLREGKIYVPGTRRSNERTLALEAHQILDMMEYTLQTRPELLKLKNKQTETLFISTGESSHFRSIIQKLMQKLKAENSKITSLQQLRTSVITHWLKMYNLRQVQYKAGHRYVSSTESYLINDLEDLQEDIGKFHPIG